MMRLLSLYLLLTTLPSLGANYIIRQSAPDILTGLVGYWTLDNGEAKDIVAADHGTVVGATASTIGLGTTAGCLQFNGTNQYVRLGDALSGTFSGANAKFSISAWIMSDAIGTYQTIYCKIASGACAEDQRAYTFRITDAGKIQFEWESLTGTFYRVVDGSSTLSSSTLYHVLMTYDGSISTGDGLGRVQFYLNGVPETETLSFTSGTLGDIGNSTAHAGIGAELNSSGTLCGTGYPWKGKLDEVRVYNVTLTASDALIVAKKHSKNSP